MQRALRSGPQPIPPAALWLGIAGLIPFIALPVLAVADRAALPVPASIGAHLTVPSLLLYAAVILSFMGGVQWGLAMARTSRRGGDSDGGRASGGDDLRSFGVSVLPALLAWFALFFETRAGLFILAVGFVMLMAYDIWTVRRGEAPAWYERLRLGLTAVVVLSISLTLTFVV